MGPSVKRPVGCKVLDAHPSPSNRMVVSPNMRTTKPTVVFSLQSMPSKHDSSISFTLVCCCCCCSWCCCWCWSCDTWLMIVQLVKSLSFINGFAIVVALLFSTDFRIGLGAEPSLLGYSLLLLRLLARDLSILTCWAIIRLLKCWDVGGAGDAAVVVAVAVDDVVVVDDDIDLRWAGCFRVHATTTKYRVRPHRVLSNFTACNSMK